MLYKEYKAATRSKDAWKPDASLTVTSVTGTCAVNDLFPLPVVTESISIPRHAAIDILDEQQQPVGIFLTCKNEDYDLGKFGAAHLAAYLLEIPADEVGRPGQFSSDYVLVKKQRLKEYRQNFLEASPIWGGFSHIVPAPISTTPLLSISAFPGIILPTVLHKEAAKRSAMLPYAFERYLKLYHLLELSFDYDTVVRIRALHDDLHGIGQILSQHKSNELVRLKQLISEKCSNPAAVTNCIEHICANATWHKQIENIFFLFGKDGNPLSDNKAQFVQMVTGPGFNQAGAIASGVITPKQAGQGAFPKLALDLSAYWIYRIRSSIAHSRIGEYVMTPQDEEFVEGFGEKLLRKVLVTVLHA